MMIRHLAYITGLLLMALCSCSDEILPDNPGADVPDGTPVGITVSAEFPEMNFCPGTRRMSDEPTADDLLDKLKINILVFDEAGIMQQFIPPTDIKTIKIDKEEKKVIFEVQNIYSSSQPRRLHFVITSAGDIRKIPGGEFITAMANETTVMPALMTEGDIDTYWGTDVVSEITKDSRLSMKVIRNFVKLDVAVTPNEDTKNFDLLGYTVVNRPNKGTVAPYIYKTKSFAEFLDSKEPDGLKTYDEVINQGYHGINPAGQEESMTHTPETVTESDLVLSPVYFYERSQSAIETVGADAKVTYLIVKGNYTDSDNNTVVSYYKLDLGHNEGGKFKYYDLLRNFQYTAQINEVRGPGAESLGEAMNGMPYNNISASVQTHDLFSISDTGELITVSDTEVIFTEQTDGFQLSFRYYLPKDPNNPNSENLMKPEYLKVYDLGVPNKEYDVSGLIDEKGYSNGTEKEIDLSGEVIKSAKLTKGLDEWYILKITTENIPEKGRLEQNLRVYYSEQTGSANLGRSITLMLRQPWVLPDVKSEKNNTIKDNAGKTLEAYNINFTLPPGLSNSQFPLTLTFESDKQNIYSLKGTELHVSVGKSGFKGATTDNVILYEYVIPRSMYDAATGKKPKKPEQTEGDSYTATFLTNTTTDEDMSYSTAGIDAVMQGTANPDRIDNNGSGTTFCIKIANAGQKCIEPYYVNITRQTPTNP